MERIKQLVALLAELTDRDGFYDTDIAGLSLSKFSTTDVPRTTINGAVFCVVAQGTKSLLVHDERYVYDPQTYLLVPFELPGVGQIIDATRTTPFLGLSLELDIAEISALILEADLPAWSARRDQPSLFVSPLDEDLLDVVIRLICLLKKPAQISILAPLVRRELFYKLLLSEQRGLLRQIADGNKEARRIMAGVAWLKEHVAEPIRMEDLARQMHMSPSAMHTWFKAVTNMSPLQYQKQLRLQEARRMLLFETADAATVSRRVGYESASQFSREYRRLFGLPPLQDIERVRTSMMSSMLQAEHA